MAKLAKDKEKLTKYTECYPFRKNENKIYRDINVESKCKSRHEIASRMQYEYTKRKTMK